MTVAAVAEKRPRRPVMRYHGGKWRLARWIIAHFPPHKIYVEPFCGAASVLMRKPRVHAEVINDLDGDVCNVFRVLRDPAQAAELERVLRLTPYAREEFLGAYELADDPVERARRTITRAAMGFGTTSLLRNKTGFRARSYLRNQTGPADFATFPTCISGFTARLRGVLVECIEALELIKRHDSLDTLFYVDPPYPACTRSSINHRSEKAQYAHEMTDGQHIKLAEILRGLIGMVVLSSYSSALYDGLYEGWTKVEREALADGGVWRVEVLFLNKAAVERRGAGDLFRREEKLLSPLDQDILEAESLGDGWRAARPRG